VRAFVLAAVQSERGYRFDELLRAGVHGDVPLARHFVHLAVGKRGVERSHGCPEVIRTIAAEEKECRNGQCPKVSELETVPFFRVSFSQDRVRCRDPRRPSGMRFEAL
jgi:hypothetical protein